MTVVGLLRWAQSHNLEYADIIICANGTEHELYADMLSYSDKHIAIQLEDTDASRRNTGA